MTVAAPVTNQEYQVAYVEIPIDHVLPYWTTLSDGRRAIVLDEAEGSGVLLILPDRDAWVPVHRLHLAAARAYEEIRAVERGDAYRGSSAAVRPADGPFTGPVGRL